MRALRPAASQDRPASRRRPLVGRGTPHLARRPRPSSTPPAAPSQHRLADPHHARDPGNRAPGPRSGAQQRCQPRGALPTMPHPARRTRAPASAVVYDPGPAGTGRPVHGTVWVDRGCPYIGQIVGATGTGGREMCHEDVLEGRARSAVTHRIGVEPRLCRPQGRAF